MDINKNRVLKSDFIFEYLILFKDKIIFIIYCGMCRLNVM